MFTVQGSPKALFLNPVLIVMTKTMMSSVNDQIRKAERQRIMTIRQTSFIVIEFPTLALRQNNLSFDCVEKYRLKGPTALGLFVCL